MRFFRRRRFFFCASTDEIRALIILTLSKANGWDLWYLSHIYFPVTVYMLQLHMIDLTLLIVRITQDTPVCLRDTEQHTFDLKMIY